MAAVHPILDAPATTAHNDGALQQEKRLRNWQLTTWWVCALATVLVVTNCTQWLTRKEHYIPVVLGQIEPPHFLNEMTPTTAHALPIQLMHVEEFIRDIRLVTHDQKVQTDRTNWAFFLCREKAQSWLRDYFSHPENAPQALLKKGITKMPVNIQITPQSGSSFTVLWDEDIQEITETVHTHWRADLTVELKDPDTLTSQERQHSPFGVFIEYVNFSRMGKM